MLKAKLIRAKRLEGALLPLPHRTLPIVVHDTQTKAAQRLRAKGFVVVTFEQSVDLFI